VVAKSAIKFRETAATDLQVPIMRMRREIAAPT
jgi:hypothetical protein